MEPYLIIVIVLVILIRGYSTMSKPPVVESPQASSIDVTPQAAAAVLDSRHGNFIGCEGEPIIFDHCPDGIKSGNIKYGRWRNDICPHASVNENTPAQFRKYPLKAGVKEIDANLNKYLNDDPYFGISKHWEADYVC